MTRLKYLKNKGSKKLFFRPNFKIKPFYPINNYFIEIKALIARLYIQIYRKPYIFIAGIIQPLLWMILFGALFQNAPIDLLQKYHIKYGQFLSPGIIIFTTFTGSINTGLPIIFDREFGFLNRLLVSPIENKNSLLLSLIIYIWFTTSIQLITIIIFSIYLFQYTLNVTIILKILGITTFIILNIASISIYMGFILPGHIEFLACIFIINLPILFSSTALAPLSFMPYWLQIIVSINPITYAIEIIRHLCINNTMNIIKTLWLNLNINNAIYLLVTINIISFIIIKNIIRYKFD
uniref:ABC transmembrane type-2 domain-containing protein n=1 Tax=Acrosorium ciliolatum TaxID=1550622 RepID=A0A1Z1M206_9FLOR|nr:hypothetical protein [Acrosorium ciliolatum]ARW60066.1 hypothetical protein [Acrosorium ciliolatum]